MPFLIQFFFIVIHPDVFNSALLYNLYIIVYIEWNIDLLESNKITASYQEFQNKGYKLNRNDIK
jgi:hypothetical protein